MQTNQSGISGKDFKASNTLNIQFYSLQAFAGELGFEYNPLAKNFQSCVDYANRKERSELGAFQSVSFASMVKAHNQDINSGEPLIIFGRSPYHLVRASAARIVKKVKITVNKKSKTFHCGGHMVALAHPLLKDIVDFSKDSAKISFGG